MASANFWDMAAFSVLFLALSPFSTFVSRLFKDRVAVSRRCARSFLSACNIAIIDTNFFVSADMVGGRRWSVGG